jgi:hypothetical protein
MNLAVLLGTSVGGAVGWWLGARFGLFAACWLSLIGTGAGLYAGRRLGG